MLADLECEDCGFIEERFYQSSRPHCRKCGGITKKLLSPNYSFTFIGPAGIGTQMGNTIKYPSSYSNIIKRG